MQNKFNYKTAEERGNQGSVYVYENIKNNDNTWHEIKKYIYPYNLTWNATNMGLGRSVSVSYLPYNDKYNIII